MEAPGRRLACQGKLTEIGHGVVDRLQPGQETDDAWHGLFRPDITGNEKGWQAVKDEELRQGLFRPEIKG